MKFALENPDSTSPPAIGLTSSIARRARLRLSMSVIGYPVVAGLLGAITDEVLGRSFTGLLLAHLVGLPLLFREIQRYQVFSRQLKS